MTTSEEKKDLLPCPFCGSSAMLEELGDHHGAYHNLGCSKRECPAHHAIYTESEAPVEDSVNWWNTRAALQESAVARVTDEGFIIETGLGIAPGSKLYLAHPSAQAIETAAIMKCVEVLKGMAAKERAKKAFIRADHYEVCISHVRALIPQDGRTQLEEFGMKVAEEVSHCIAENHQKNGVDDEMLSAIVTNLIGEKK